MNIKELSRKNQVIFSIIIVAVLAFFTVLFIFLNTDNNAEEKNEIINQESNTEFSIRESNNISSVVEGRQNQSLPYTEIIDGEIHYWNAGSSTCQPIVESAELSDDNVISLHIADYTNTPCTMDYRVYHQVISHDDIDINDSTEININ